MKKITHFLDHLLTNIQQNIHRQANKQQQTELSPHDHLSSTLTHRQNKYKIISKKQLRNQCLGKLSKKSHVTKKQCMNEGMSNGTELGSAQRNCRHIERRFKEYIIKGNNEDLYCSICKNEFLTPAITECNHLFCLECIENSLKYSIKCPLCRSQISNADHYGLKLFQSIEKLSIRISQYKNKDIHLMKLQVHNKWKDDRFIKEEELKEKGMIDLWDLNTNKWKRGEILKVFNDEDPLSIMLQFKGHAEKEKEIIELPSLRLASYKFYSLDQPGHQEDRYGFNFFLLSSSIMRQNFPHGRSTMRAANDNIVQVYSRLRQERQRQRRVRRQERQREGDQTRQRLRVLRQLQMQNQRQQSLDIMLYRRPRVQLMIQRSSGQREQRNERQQLLRLTHISERNHSLFSEIYSQSYQQSSPAQMFIQGLEDENEFEEIIDQPNNLHNLRPDYIVQQQIIQNDHIDVDLPNLNPNDEIIYIQSEVEQQNEANQDQI